MTPDEALAALTAPGARFEVVDGVVGGVPMRHYAGTAPPTLRSVVSESAAHGDRDFLVYEGERLTFAQHHRLVGALARHLRGECGLTVGDRVAIAMRNYPEWSIAFWAAHAAGLVAVPLNAWWTAAELEFALEDAGARMVVADRARLDLLGGVLHTEGLGAIAVRAPGHLPSGVDRWEEVTAAANRDASWPEVPEDPDAAATILYTSGTTGRPKGAVASHRNHVTNLVNVAVGIAVGRLAAGIDPSDPAPVSVALQTLPLFHIGGVSGLALATWFGDRLVLLHKWDASRALELIEQERVTSITGVPTVVRQLLDCPDLDDRDVSSVVSMASGGAAVAPDLLSKVDARFGTGAALAAGYGLTETTSAVVTNGGPGYVERPTSCGRPTPLTRLRITDPDSGRELGVGDIGEVGVFGPNVVRGYWNDLEATRAAFCDGWFRTGDLGHLDEDGYLYIVDRIKDVIIRGGENVYCAEVEAVLFEHPAVLDVALVGVPHDVLGEEVGAVVVPSPGIGITASELQQHVAARLARFKVPAHVVIRQEPLPRTATGKVLKRDLRTAFEDQGQRRRLP